MLKNLKKISVSSIILLSLLASASSALAAEPDPNFNPSHIISDAEILDYNSMTKDEIQAFLESRGSYLARYSMANPNTGVMETAAEIIYGRCQANLISPKFVIVLLQKEQGLIEDPAPSQGSLDWATGYGCPDGGGCNPRWQGLWKQINSATLQFYDYIENHTDYTYQQGKTYSFSNKYSTSIQGTVSVTPYNKATASLYNYTPHVYNGNYNFWKLWGRYFAKTHYPNGSLLQARGEAGVWLIQNGEKKTIHL
jgi:hypothetical protein